MLCPMHRIGRTIQQLARGISGAPTRHNAGAAKETFLNGSSAKYLEDMYNLWLQDHSRVHPSWGEYFRNMSTNTPNQEQGSTQGAAGGGATVSDKSIEEYLAVQAIIRSYQTRGHLVAEVDPLGIRYGELESIKIDRKVGEPSERVVRHYMASLGNSPEAMNKVYKLPDTTFIGGGKEDRLSLSEILKRLENAYCKRIGVEFMYITSLEKCQWIRKHFETPGITAQSADEKKKIVRRLVRSAGFEKFLARKYSSEKRFGLEGCEVLIPALEQIIDRASLAKIDTYIMGMPHRGRLNVLANVCHKPLHHMFTQFIGIEPSDTGSGDVKYHLGTSLVRHHHSGQDIRISLVANPSHLEVVNPVVQGRTRGEQFKKGDMKGKKVLSILCHGDASFSGEGIVYETFTLSNLPNYTTHGTIHIVVNNQVGFTTDPRFSRSSPYPTDVARVVLAPIFHVNADYPEDVIHCCNVAVDYRNKFHSDVIIDLVCYRRNGHTEIDEPMFTQPLMYKIIKKKMPVQDMYFQKLIEEKVVTKEEVKDETERYSRQLESEFQKALKETTMKWGDWVDSPWDDFFKGKDPLKINPTGVNEDILNHIGKLVSSPPPDKLNFEIHKGLEKVLKARMSLVEQRRADWALGEMMAFGTLLGENVHVRLSGEDVERGTFSHRHHVLHHQSRDKEMYIPMQHLFPGKQAMYTVCNSSLSEYGVLGFETGYSMCSPDWLIIWEAQFGDFNNNAQCVIDQFLSAGEKKWNRQCGLVMLNPHGMEGMGPEHSSGHLERFLQLTDDDPDSMPDIKDPNFVVNQLRSTNWIVINCSNPANMFHAFRRQIAMPFRKPLIFFSPKSLLRHPEVTSSFDDMKEGTEFKRLIPEAGPASQGPEKVKKLIFCSGKVYYELLTERKKRGLEGIIALSRFEQLCPFPYDLVLKEIAHYPHAELCWTQEEHKNHGAWGYVLQRLATALCGTERDLLTYAGREAAAAAATGSKPIYLRQRENFIEEAMTFHEDPAMSVRSAKPCARHHK